MSQGGDNGTVQQMAETIRKMQADMEALRTEKETWRSERETLQSENLALRKEITTEKSKDRTMTKGTLESVARRLNMDDPDEEEYDEEIDVENPDSRIQKRTINGRMKTSQGDTTKDKRHKSSKSRNRVTKIMRK